MSEQNSADSTQVQVDPIQQAAESQGLSKNQLEHLAFGTPLDQVDNTASAGTNNAAADQVAAQAAAADVVVDGYWKAYGVDSEDAFKQKVESWKQLETTPKEEYKYANEESRRLAEAINDPSKRSEVISILNTQAQIERLISSEVSKDTAPEIVKLGMQLKYKDLTPEEINYKFNKQFSIPAKPVQSDIDTDDEFNDKVSAWQDLVNDKTMELMIEAKLAKPEIEQSKTKIELPAIQPQKQGDYEAYKARLAEEERIDQEVAAKVNSLSESDFQFKISVEDAQNQIKADVSFVADKADLDAAKVNAQNFGEFFCDDKGNFLPQKAVTAALLTKNFDKYIQTAVRQAVNAERKRALEMNTGGSGSSMIKDYNIDETLTPEQKILKENMDRAFYRQN